MPEIPAGATVPQDHKPATKKTKKPKKAHANAAVAEATGGSLAVEHEGATYVIEGDIFTDVEFLEHYADLQADSSRLPLVVRSMLGPKQWEAFKSANRNDRGRVPLESLNGLFEAADRALGNRQASSGS